MKMVLFIRDNIKTEKDMEGVDKYGQMDLIMKENGLMIWLKVSED